MAPLATLIHISDLHFGMVDPTTMNAETISLWAKCRHFDGLLGHSYLSLVHLEQVVTRLRREENAFLLVTGDLTTIGNTAEFDTAQEYLGNFLQPPRGNFLGLNFKDWQRLTIPGNHDHWPGTPTILGGPNTSFNNYFRALPRVERIAIEDFTLTVICVNSDSDVSPYGSERVLARGSFRSQLVKLSGSLAAETPNEREIRVLLIHHSYSASGLALAMNSASRAALHDFIYEHNIGVLLCGHIHQPPVVNILRVSRLQHGMKCLEARCGTSTQISTLPYNWRNALGVRPSRPDRLPNSILVHRLLRTEVGIVWTTKLLIERPWGFESAGNAVPRWPPDTEFTVWPSSLRQLDMANP